jgi:uncharacterized protein with HEPN domain
MEADQIGRLRDILTASRLIAAYVKDTSEADFQADPQKQDAVVRRIEIIGEATAHLSDETRREMPALSFRKMRGMRNRSMRLTGFQTHFTDSSSSPVAGSIQGRPRDLRHS